MVRRAGSPSLSGVSISIAEQSDYPGITKTTIVNGVSGQEIDWTCTSQSTYAAPGGQRSLGD
jgi:hypothetical protein